MGCCLGCFRNNDYVNEVNQNNTPSTGGLSNACGQKLVLQESRIHEAQKKNEWENGMQAIFIYMQAFLDKQHKRFRLLILFYSPSLFSYLTAKLDGQTKVAVSWTKNDDKNDDSGPSKLLMEAPTKDCEKNDETPNDVFSPNVTNAEVQL